MLFNITLIIIQKMFFETVVGFANKYFSFVQTLTTGLEEQVKKEVARLEMEIKQVADKALHAVQNWYGC